MRDLAQRTIVIVGVGIIGRLVVEFSQVQAGQLHDSAGQLTSLYFREFDNKPSNYANTFMTMIVW